MLAIVSRSAVTARPWIRGAPAVLCGTAIVAAIACGGGSAERAPAPGSPTPTNGAGAAGGMMASGSGGAATHSGGKPAADLGGSTAVGGMSPGGAPTDGGGGTGGATVSAAGGLSVSGAGGASAGSVGSNGNGGGGQGNLGASGGGGGIEVPSGYKLVWNDEFDVDGPPNPANWKFEKGFVRNEEAQWYQSNNASVSGGLLLIEARRERVSNPNYRGSGDWKTTREYAEYTSSSLLTNGLHSWQYGRFEMRARIPTAAGMWPAWWTLGVSGEWPSNGEIDIMEFYQNKVLANVACGTATRWEAKWDSNSKPLASLGEEWPSEFHVWRMDWDARTIVIYMDGVEMNSTPLSSMLNANGESPFEQKAYMIVNLAIGGINGGSPSTTTFPQRLEVDYIRVFQ